MLFWPSIKYPQGGIAKVDPSLDQVFSIYGDARKVYKAKSDLQERLAGILGSLVWYCTDLWKCALLHVQSHQSECGLVEKERCRGIRVSMAPTEIERLEQLYEPSS